MKWQPCAAMCFVVCSLGVMSSPASNGRLGQISEDRRNSRH
jgi:hypothetical protein